MKHTHGITHNVFRHFYMAVIVICLVLWIGLFGFEMYKKVWTTPEFSVITVPPIVIEDGTRDPVVDDDVGKGLDIAYGNSSVAYISYVNVSSTASAIHYISRELDGGGSYSPSVVEQIVVEDASNVYDGVWTTSIAVDQSQQPVVLYHERHSASSSLKFAIRDGGSGGGCTDADWSCYEVVSSTSYISNFDFAIDSNNVYGIAYYMIADSALHYATCSVDCSNFANWTFEIVDNDADVGTYPAITFDSSDVAYISYLDSTNSRLKYATRDGGGSGSDCTDTDWSCYVVDESIGVSGDSASDIAVDQDGSVGIVYVKDTGELLYASAGGTGTGCTNGSIFDCEEVSAVNNQHFPSITFQGIKPVIASGVISAPTVFIKYAVGWSGTAVDGGANDGGNYTGIDNSQGNIVVGYYDYNNAEAMLSHVFISSDPRGEFATSTAERTDGSGIVDVYFDVSDREEDRSYAGIYYYQGACSQSGVVTAASLDPDDEDTTATFGDPKLGGNTVGTASGWIETLESTTNTISFDWSSSSDKPLADGTYCIQAQLADGTSLYTGVAGADPVYPEIAVTLDNVSPTTPDNLTVNTTSTDSVILNLTASTDTNFSEYIIYYASSTPVTTSDASLTSSTFSYFASSTWEGHTTTTLSSLTENTRYYVRLWAYDSYGHSAQTASELNFFTLAPTPTGLAKSVDGTAASFSVTQFTNDTVSSSGYYFALTKTVGGTAVSNSGWSTDNTWSVTGLEEGTGYTISVQYRNSDGVETSAVTDTFTTDEAVNNTGGIPPPPPPPPPADPDGDDPECTSDECLPDPENPSGLILINNGNQYTNSTNVTLTFNTVFTEAYALSDVDDFTGLSFIPIVSTLPYVLPSGDGDKYVYARFHNQYGNYDAHDVIILDTSAPEKPVFNGFAPLASLRADGVYEFGGLGDDDFIQPTLSGTAEAGAQVQIIKQKVTPLAGPVPVIYDVDVADDGTWQFQLPQVLFQGLYMLTLKTIDPATNESESVVLNVDVGGSGEEFPEPIDTDEDGIMDDFDNCPFIPNPSQLDSDGDGKGDACDIVIIDTDKDGIADTQDNCPLTANSDQVDSDKDGKGNACDLCAYDYYNDADNDGICADVDNCPVIANAAQANADGDSFGNACDICPYDAANQCKIKPIKKPTDQDDTDTSADTIDSGESTTDIGSSSLVTSTQVLTSTISHIAHQGTDHHGPTTTITENIEDASTQIIDLIPDNVVQTLSIAGVRVKKIINNPQVEQINEVAVVPAIVVAGAANVAVGFQLPQVIVLLRYIFGQPLLLLRRRKQKQWGVVYNAFNKHPIDLATIRVVNADTGKVIRSAVTDGQGRYYMILKKGRYTMQVKKPQFGGFSEYLFDKTEDAKYINLYHGETFEVTEDKSEIHYNIPLDPIGKTGDSRHILTDKAERLFHYGFSLVGFMVSVLTFIISPQWWIAALSIVHVIFFIVAYKFSHTTLPASYGVVSLTHKKKPLKNVVIRVFDAMYHRLVETGVTDRKGRYAILVGPSEYYVTYEKKGYSSQKLPHVDFSSEKTRGMGGIINAHVGMDRAV